MIGIFDSGVGGLSVWRELVKILPDERYIYVSDNGYCPYGPKPKSEVIERAKKITEFLMKQGADIIVVACNTATAAAIDVLRSSYDIPFVGMEPAVKPAALNTDSGVIGVLATQGTFKGELYLRTLHKFASNTKVIEQVGTGLVELVESGNTESVQAEELLKKYLDPMMEAGADHLVLGCTHYPFLEKVIRNISGNSFVIVNPAPAVASRTRDLLGEISVGNNEGNNIFYTTGKNTGLIEKMVRMIMAEDGMKGLKGMEFHAIDI